MAKASRSFQDLTPPEKRKKQILATRRKLGATIRRPIPAWLRRYVYMRDRYICQRAGCGATTGLTVDHIIPLALGGTDHEENLQTLCYSCNNEKGHRVA